jgi:negative regulator of flagellin synthesis FlgM
LSPYRNPAIKKLKVFAVLPIKFANEEYIEEYDMAIEVTGRTNSPTPIKTTPKAGVDGEKKVAVTTPENHDVVALTTATQEIKKAFGSSSASPVDIDRINSIKKALADGSYQIDAEKVAKKLIEFEKLMP